MKKYTLLKNDTIEHDGHKLYRIKALQDIPLHSVKTGDLGGYVESEDNLSHDNDCWIGGNAKVWGNAEVYGNAKVYENAEVGGNAQVCGNAKVFGNAYVFEDAKVYGDVKVFDDAEVFGDARVFGRAYVYGNAWVCDAQVSGKAWVFGNARVSGDAEVCGNAQVCGTTELSTGYHEGVQKTKQTPEPIEPKQTETKDKIVLAKFEIVSTNGKLELVSKMDGIDTQALLKQLMN
jgi:carbonic anhydrase/acetyltransferase-like protein (isoleucine patch superfamily)